MLRVAGGGLLFATAGIHLDLYVTGYHSIPTIGILFLLQVISAFALGAAVLVRGGFLVNASAAGFCASTIGGYLLSRAVGLFGFKEVPTTAGLVAGLIEVAALALLGYLAVAELAPSSPAKRPLPGPIGKISARPAGGLLAIVTLAALVLTLVAGTGSAGTPNPSTAATGGSSAATGGGASVTITITNFTFVPATVTVKPGEKIRVVNKDSVAHTLTAVPGSTPLGKFDTGNLGANQSATITAPMAAGSYNYYCAIHNFMTGVLTVS